MIDSTTFDALRSSYGDVASWAVWSLPDGRRTGAWVSDLRVFDDWPGAGLHNRAVLIALNSGVREPGGAPRPTWGMFHDPVGRDFMLAEAVRGTGWWGSYLTDFFKGLPTRTGAGLREHLARHPEVEGRAATELRAELDRLGGRPVLVCLGVQVAPFVRRHLGADHDVVAVSHYSRAMTKAFYRAEFEALGSPTGQEVAS